MAHFAELDNNNIVKRVIVVSNKDCKTADGVEKESIGIAHCEKVFGGRWVQTSYNSSFRKIFAGKGMKYDADLDMFILQQPFASWTLDENGDWQPPTPAPTDGKVYNWNETTLSWEEMSE